MLYSYIKCEPDTCILNQNCKPDFDGVAMMKMWTKIPVIQNDLLMKRKLFPQHMCSPKSWPLTELFIDTIDQRSQISDYRCCFTDLYMINRLYFKMLKFSGACYLKLIDSNYAPRSR